MASLLGGAGAPWKSFGTVAGVTTLKPDWRSLCLAGRNHLTLEHAAGVVRTSKLSQRKWWTLID